LYCSLAPPSLPTQPKISPLSAKFFRSKKKIPFAHSLAASSFLITPVHVELHRKIHSMAYESESDHGDNDDEGDEFDFEDNDNDNDDDDFASRTRQ
jgi:hypothetical protein